MFSFVPVNWNVKNAYLTGVGSSYWSKVLLYSSYQFDNWNFISNVVGEQITEKGIGNGISLLIFAGIVSSLPGAIAQLFQQAKQGQMNVVTLFFVLSFIAAIVMLVVFIERGLRKIPIQHPKRHQTQAQQGAGVLPLKINMSGVIPPIFASALILFPASVAGMLPNTGTFSGFSYVLSLITRSTAIHSFIRKRHCFLLFFYTSITQTKSLIT